MTSSRDGSGKSYLELRWQAWVIPQHVMFEEKGERREVADVLYDIDLPVKDVYQQYTLRQETNFGDAAASTESSPFDESQLDTLVCPVSKGKLRLASYTWKAMAHEILCNNAAILL